VQQWFYVGVSIAPLLQLDSGWQFIRACAQLMEEYEYHFANVAVQGMVRFQYQQTLPLLTKLHFVVHLTLFFHIHFSKNTENFKGTYCGRR